MLINRPAVANQVLELARSRVARPHQHEHPGLAAARLARMARRHRGRGRDSRSRHPLPRPRGRARPRPCRRTRHRRKPPPSRRCRCACCRGSSSRTLGASLAQQPLQGRQPGGATRLEKCTLWLHHRHQRGHDTQDAATKFLEGVRNRTQVVSAMAITDFARDASHRGSNPTQSGFPRLRMASASRSAKCVMVPRGVRREGSILWFSPQS